MSKHIIVIKLEQIKSGGFTTPTCVVHVYFAYSTALVSRITVTLM